ncbi:NAD(+) synthase [Candidatus Roizmanbacteria bacterium RIFCSPHIGHO2_01_FULL_39_12c]|uniref:NH(3)-dependent NAD(+) synthetase n=1 Tax=Candidatus Roizmanbacteria bacterium RIFCSPHIGHO2_01_FULL_39_12c TaxID=1802031 RepID=A0A1F7GA05_9BACT|nr:MAG: NAD(+) synthase [Candidatus Roizmanbacteria bacterium RIFCSPHIGHO2_01_FULL_39_12c]OGK46221.1 MAG: NAD(+) synthase [Candidatus Roizmanbacteria bacterium RIFCSPLOWO2_01_FULL_40_13]
MNPLIAGFNLKKESEKIIKFLKAAFAKTGLKKLVIGVSGGVDSAASLYLAAKAIRPQKILIAHLYYFQPHISLIRHLCSSLQIPPQNQLFLSIKKPVDELKKSLELTNQHLAINRIRFGNVMARVRMLILFDLAKKHRALVYGTENKSENLLGYFTRYGDAASDIEPISHLYKTQVFQLAKYLKLPPKVLKAKPSAGLWVDQTDEGEFGFTYQEADQVLYQYFDKKISVSVIKKHFPNAEKIINFSKKNQFKQVVPYCL